ncbi:MAG: DUF3556 domain-containing protein [Polyangiaceae bacterium]|nr:DUF3556 domain-containing protein [Polyangiaceae bacterium]
MQLPQPKLPPYDVAEWLKKPFQERLKWVCQAWAIQGYGTPGGVYAVYLIKIVFYVAVWLFFCGFSQHLGGPSTIGTWWHDIDALKRAVLWSMAFEVLGLGCGSGPLTGRYYPPVGGFLYFARPRTTKAPLFPRLPLLGGHRRTPLDVGLYLAYLALLFRALVAPEISPYHVLPIAIILPVLGICDKTIFLASRAEHYFSVAVCCLFPLSTLPAAKAVWLAIWFWAATSKLNNHFPAVICVMISNSPVLGVLRRRMYRGYPDDLRPSRLAHLMAHAGTLTEYMFPALLAFGTGGKVTLVALVVMLGFHLFITSNIPMAVPIEWNVIMVYGGFVLFGHHAGVRFWDVSSPELTAYLLFALVVLPIVGNVAPRFVSFLVSMRYYAGNWAYGVWLFKGESLQKLDKGVVKSAPLVQDQLRKFYPDLTATALLSKVIAFRAMHLHGRALNELIPKAVDNIEEYTWLDGEIVGGLVLGWNFGEGHLHNEPFIQALQAQCHFAPGEVRCILVEAQPMFQRTLSYRIVDASQGEIDRGEIAVSSLINKQPWCTERDT